MTDWALFLQVITNTTVLVAGIKLIRHISRLEFKVEQLWEEYEERHSPAVEKRNTRRGR